VPFAVTERAEIDVPSVFPEGTPAG